MKLTDKRFWKYETLSVLAAALTMVIVLLHGTIVGFDFIVVLVVLVIYIIGQMVAWKVVKYGSWLKLGLMIYLFSGIVFAFVVTIIWGIDMIIYKDPEDISLDTPLWFSDSAFYIFLNIGWLIFSLIPAFSISGITSIWLKLPQKFDGTKLMHYEKMNKEKLVSMLTAMGIENWEYSYNNITNWDCIVLYESGNEFQVIYVDDRGEQEIKAVLATESDACNYILQLFKEQKEFEKEYRIN